MKMQVIALSALLVLAGCSLDQGNGPEGDLAGANYIALDGSPVAEGTPMETTEETETVFNGTHVFYPADANGNPDYTRPLTVETASRKLHPAHLGDTSNKK